MCLELSGDLLIAHRRSNGGAKKRRMTFN
ncbi:hypothetical protein OYC64_016846 [Pagothenia borchgrevinki]|uniref:Uncharacterized protein n=1 Tax=Pagothenia borchgrevinki TaxID=8213 RepID=A0ABD2HSL7_PAGBO